MIKLGQDCEFGREHRALALLAHWMRAGQVSLNNHHT